MSAAPTEQPFGASLEPVLRQACGSRLSKVNWFRTDWQRGGALTGYAHYRDDADVEQPVVVKLPVPPAERFWLVRLQAYENVVPVVYADGEALSGYDMAWVVMERLPHGPLDSSWSGNEFDLLVEAAARFYAAVAHFPVDSPAEDRDWAALLRQARANVQQHQMADEQRWSIVLKKAQRKLKHWLSIWESRSIDNWCHGDLHLGNAMTRVAAPAGPAVLLDFALTHRGNWVEDAVYLEHLYWSRKGALSDRKLCRQIARERKRLGLPVEKDWAQLAQARRMLIAISTPANLRQDGNPRHVEAALEVLEAEVGR